MCDPQQDARQPGRGLQDAWQMLELAAIHHPDTLAVVDCARGGRLLTALRHTVFMFPVRARRATPRRCDRPTRIWLLRPAVVVVGASPVSGSPQKSRSWVWKFTLRQARLAFAAMFI